MRSLSVSVLVFTSLVLVSCGAPEASTVATGSTGALAKTPFQITLQSVNDLPRSALSESIGRTQAASTLTVNSQGIGRVETILKQEGAPVRAGEPIALLADTTANYVLALQSAQNALSRARVEYSSADASAKKSLLDAQLALARSEKDLATARSDAQERIDQATYAVGNANIWAAGSNAALTLSRLQADIVANQSTIDSLIQTQEQTLKNFTPTFQLTVSDLAKTISSLVYDSDRLIGVSDTYRNVNDTFETYLGARNSSLRPRLEGLFLQMQALERQLNQKRFLTVNISSLTSELNVLDDNYIQATQYAEAVIELLEASVESNPAFTRATIDGYLSQFNGYKTQLQALRSQYVNFRNTSSSFLATYRTQREGQQRQLDALRASYETQRKALETTAFDSSVSLDRTNISVSDTIKWLELTLQGARNTLENTRTTNALTLQRLSVAIADASVALERAQRDVEKLTILSPIDGRVNALSVVIGQDVAPSTVVASLVGGGVEILLDVSSQIASTLSIGTVVPFEIAGRMATGTISGIGIASDETLLRSVRILAQDVSLPLGEIATVRFTTQQGAPLIPLSSVKIIGSKQGEITLFTSGTLVTTPVTLGATLSGAVEITSTLPPEAQIVLSDVSQYDERTMELAVSGQ